MKNKKLIIMTGACFLLQFITVFCVFIHRVKKNLVCWETCDQKWFQGSGSVAPFWTKTWLELLNTENIFSRTMFNAIHIFSKCAQNIILFFIVKLLLLQNISKQRPMNHNLQLFPGQVTLALIFVYFQVNGRW